MRRYALRDIHPLGEGLPGIRTLVADEDGDWVKWSDACLAIIEATNRGYSEGLEKGKDDASTSWPSHCCRDRGPRVVRPTPELMATGSRVAEAVCRRFACQAPMVLAGCQARDCCAARAVCCAVLRRTTDWSQAAIAGAMGLSGSAAVHAVLRRAERPALAAVVVVGKLEG